ncbi:hypothetical protein Tco_0152504 [Tanacetum coccineum]
MKRYSHGGESKLEEDKEGTYFRSSHYHGMNWHPSYLTARKLTYNIAIACVPGIRHVLAEKHLNAILQMRDHARCQDYTVPILMEISKEDQIALDDALVAPDNRLKIEQFHQRHKEVEKKAIQIQPLVQKPPTVPQRKEKKKSGRRKAELKELETIFEMNQNDDKNDDDENVQDDDDEAQTKSEDDGDDFIHPKLTTHDDETTHEEETDEDDSFDPIVHTPSRVSSLDDEGSDNDVEGLDAEGEKSDEDATYIDDQGNEADKDTNANLEGRDEVMTDVILL